MTARSLKQSLRNVTPSGWLTLSLTITGALAAIILGWIEAGALAITGAVLLVTAIPFLRGSAAYAVHLNLPATTATVGSALSVGVTVENTAGHRQPGSQLALRVGNELHRIGVPALTAQSTQVRTVSVSAERRGVVLVGPVTLRRSDPLGLFRREMSWADQYEVCVHPKTVSLPALTAGFVRDISGLASSKLTDADLSFHAVREYAQGDAMRHIHWKSTAKQGTLMVRQYEESQSASIAVLFDANESAYESSTAFELGLSAAASISAQAVREGRERLTAVSDVRRRGDALTVLPVRTLTELLNAWSNLEPTAGGQNAVALLQQYARSNHSHALTVVVSGALNSVSDIRRASSSLRQNTQLIMVCAVPLAEPQLRRIGSTTVITIGALEDLPSLLLRSST